MCKPIFIDKTEEVIETIGELKEVYPKLEIIPKKGCEVNDDHCFCGIDIHKTFKGGGIKWEVDDEFIGVLN
jgi:hypothetical protein